MHLKKQKEKKMKNEEKDIKGLILTGLQTDEYRTYYKFYLKNEVNEKEGFIKAKEGHKGTCKFASEVENRLIGKLIRSALDKGLNAGTGVKHENSEKFQKVCKTLGVDWKEVAKFHVMNATDITVEKNRSNANQAVVIFQHSDYLVNTKAGVVVLPNLYLKAFARFDCQAKRYIYDIDFHDDISLRSFALERLLKDKKYNS